MPSSRSARQCRRTRGWRHERHPPRSPGDSTRQDSRRTGGRDNTPAHVTEASHRHSKRVGRIWATIIQVFSTSSTASSPGRGGRSQILLALGQANRKIVQRAGETSDVVCITCGIPLKGSVDNHKPHPHVVHKAHLSHPSGIPLHSSSNKPSIRPPDPARERRMDVTAHRRPETAHLCGERWGSGRIRAGRRRSWIVPGLIDRDRVRLER